MTPTINLKGFRFRMAIVLLGAGASIYIFVYAVFKEEDDIQDDEFDSFVIKDLSEEENGQYPILVWWTPFTGEHGVQKKCGREICYFTDRKKYFNHSLTRAFLFYGSDFKPTDLPLPRSFNHDWALLHEESPKNNYLFSTEKVMELFNHTATFRQESDLPLTLQYLDSIESLTSKKFFNPTKVKNSRLASLAPVVYVHSDCDTPSDRDTYVNELMKYIAVDSYGKCLHNKDLPQSLIEPISGMDAEAFWKIIAEYKFSLAFENAVCEDYITEKLWRPLSVGSVPIYYGAPSVKKWLPHRRSAIVVTDFPTPKLLAEYIHQLNVNDTAYEAHLYHKLQGRISNRKLVEAMKKRNWGINNDMEKRSYIEHFECLVCKRVSNNFKAEQQNSPITSFQAHLNHYGCPKPVSPLTGQPDMQSWWLEMYNKAHHEARALEQLLNRGKNFSANEFYREVIKLLDTEGLR